MIFEQRFGRGDDGYFAYKSDKYGGEFNSEAEARAFEEATEAQAKAAEKYKGKPDQIPGLRQAAEAMTGLVYSMSYDDGTQGQFIYKDDQLFPVNGKDIVYNDEQYYDQDIGSYGTHKVAYSTGQSVIDQAMADPLSWVASNANWAGLGQGGDFSALDEQMKFLKDNKYDLSSMPNQSGVNQYNLTKQILAQGTTGKWSGQGYGGPVENAKVMAGMLANTGIKDIKDFGKFNGVVSRFDQVVYPKDPSDLSKGYVIDELTADREGFTGRRVDLSKDAKVSQQNGFDNEGNPTSTAIASIPVYGETFGNKVTKQSFVDTQNYNRANGNIFSGTYAGNNQTQFGVQFAADGTPVFYTQEGPSTSNVGEIMQVASLAMSLFAPGIGGAIGSALTGTAANTVISQVIGNAIVQGTMTELSGGDFKDGAISGALSAGLSSAVSSTIGKAVADAVGNSDLGKVVTKAVTSASTAAISTAIKGGDVEQAALNAAVTSVGSTAGKILGGDTGAIVGSAVSKLALGKDADQVLLSAVNSVINNAVKEAGKTKDVPGESSTQVGQGEVDAIKEYLADNNLQLNPPGSESPVSEIQTTGLGSRGIFGRFTGNQPDFSTGVESPSTDPVSVDTANVITPGSDALQNLLDTSSDAGTQVASLGGLSNFQNLARDFFGFGQPDSYQLEVPSAPTTVAGAEVATPGAVDAQTAAPIGGLPTSSEVATTEAQTPSGGLEAVAKELAQETTDATGGLPVDNAVTTPAGGLPAAVEAGSSDASDAVIVADGKATDGEVVEDTGVPVSDAATDAGVTAEGGDAIAATEPTPAPVGGLPTTGGEGGDASTVVAEAGSTTPTGGLPVTNEVAGTGTEADTTTTLADLLDTGAVSDLDKVLDSGVGDEAAVVSGGDTAAPTEGSSAATEGDGSGSSEVVAEEAPVITGGLPTVGGDTVADAVESDSTLATTGGLPTEAVAPDTKAVFDDNVIFEGDKNDGTAVDANSVITDASESADENAVADTDTTGGLPTDGVAATDTDADTKGDMTAEGGEDGGKDGSESDEATVSTGPQAATGPVTEDTANRQADEFGRYLDDLTNPTDMPTYANQDLQISQDNLDSFDKNLTDIVDNQGGLTSQWQQVGSDSVLVLDDGSGIVLTEDGDTVALSTDEVQQLVDNKILNTGDSGYVEATGGTGNLPGGSGPATEVKTPATTGGLPVTLKPITLSDTTATTPVTTTPAATTPATSETSAAANPFGMNWLDTTPQLLTAAKSDKQGPIKMAQLRQLYGSLTPEMQSVFADQGIGAPEDDMQMPAFATGGTTQTAQSLIDSLTPKFASSPKFLESAPVTQPQSRLGALRHLKNPKSAPQQPAGMAQGGLPTKYSEAAPQGHKPEFITGVTGYYAQGGGTGQSDDIPAMLHDGDYVIDADAVAAFGDGSSKAGAQVLAQFQSRIPFKDDGAAKGRPVAAKIADGEYVFPSAFVTALGRGDNKQGAKILDAMRANLRQHKRSAPTSKIPPKAKSPLDYLKTVKG